LKAQRLVHAISAIATEPVVVRPAMRCSIKLEHNFIHRCLVKLQAFGDRVVPLAVNDTRRMQSIRSTQLNSVSNSLERRRADSVRQ
jgi:hypothetical protein